ncbi:hypothetical protein ACLOJK_007250 [Asimina triloba]
MGERDLILGGPGYVIFVEKGNTKLVTNLPDSMLEWKLKFFYARLVMRDNSCSVPDRWVEKLPEPVFTPAKELETH